MNNPWWDRPFEELIAEREASISLWAALERDLHTRRGRLSLLWCVGFSLVQGVNAVLYLSAGELLCTAISAAGAIAMAVLVVWEIKRGRWLMANRILRSELAAEIAMLDERWRRGIRRLNRHINAVRRNRIEQQQENEEGEWWKQ